MILRFRSEPGEANNLRLRAHSIDRATLLGTFDSLPGPTPPNPFTEEVPGSYSCEIGALAGCWFVSVSFLDTSEVTVDGFASDTDPELRSDQAPSIALASDSEDAIALSVYQRLAGSRAALLSAPAPAGDTLDTIITVDFDYTIPVVVADTSKLIWFVRIRPRSTDALLIAKKSVGLAELLGDEVPTMRGSAADASLTHTDTSVTVHVAAAAMQLLPLGNVHAELREVTAAGAQITRHEVQLDLRLSAGRVLD